MGGLASNVWSFDSDGEVKFFFGQILANYGVADNSQEDIEPHTA